MHVCMYEHYRASGAWLPHEVPFRENGACLPLRRGDCNQHVTEKQVFNPPPRSLAVGARLGKEENLIYCYFSLLLLFFLGPLSRHSGRGSCQTLLCSCAVNPMNGEAMARPAGGWIHAEPIHPH